MRPTFVAASMVALASCARPPGRHELPIVGGEAEPGWPGVVVAYNVASHNQCTGTAIAPRVVVTANSAVTSVVMATAVCAVVPASALGLPRRWMSQQSPAFQGWTTPVGKPTDEEDEDAMGSGSSNGKLDFRPGGVRVGRELSGSCQGRDGAGGG